MIEHDIFSISIISKFLVGEYGRCEIMSKNLHLRIILHALGISQLFPSVYSWSVKGVSRQNWIGWWEAIKIHQGNKINNKAAHLQIYRIMYVLPWISIFCHEWQKSVFKLTHTLIYFLHANLRPTERTNPLKQSLLISPFSPKTVLSEFILLGFVTSPQLNLTSREREVLALWRHIRRLFLQAQIGAKAIFTSE